MFKSLRAKRRNKKLEKRNKRFLYRVIKAKGKIKPFIYYPALILGIVMESVRKVLKFCYYTFYVSVFMFIVVVIFIYPKYEEYHDKVIEIMAGSKESDFRISESSYVYDKDGNEIANLHENSDATYLKYSDIPQDVVNAYVAIEDRTFWTNDGYDIKGIIRVCVNYVKTNGEEKHGASTITQQLARGIYLTREVSIDRKVKEILLANELTKKYSKQQIMEYYVNDICYANGIYGIAGASKTYFNKDVSDLSLRQITYLCAIPNSPEYYNPFKNQFNAIERSNKILNDMFECDYITEAELNGALSEIVTIQKQTYEFNDYPTTYAVDCAIKELMKQSGFEFEYVFETMNDYTDYHERYDEMYSIVKHRLYTGGYKIYTSLDLPACSNAQEVLDNCLAFDEEVNESNGVYSLQGAITIIDNNTGKVVALVGGRSQDFDSNVYSLNRAYQSFRQPGSSIKPLVVYTPALENGYKDSTWVQNISVAAAKTSKDIQGLIGTIMTLRSAVEHSKNGVAYQVYDALTPARCMPYLTNMQFSNLCPSDYFNSTALGGLTYGVNTVEMASAYSCLANHGSFVEPTCLVSLVDRDGNELYEDEPNVDIYTVKAADDMVDILKGVPIRGTASKLGWYNHTDIEAFCKTGTTNQSKDGWLCGATPYYSIAVWVGYDQPRPLSNLYGATYPGQIWRDSMLLMIQDKAKAEFVRDEEDSSYSEVFYKPSHYKYLEGRDDAEVLSEGYTVADYREDRVTGELLLAIVNQINSLDLASPDYQINLETLHAQGITVSSSVFSNSYRDELLVMLETAYQGGVARLVAVQPSPVIEQ